MQVAFGEPLSAEALHTSSASDRPAYGIGSLLCWYKGSLLCWYKSTNSDSQHILIGTAPLFKVVDVKDCNVSKVADLKDLKARGRRSVDTELGAPDDWYSRWVTDMAVLVKKNA